MQSLLPSLVLIELSNKTNAAKNPARPRGRRPLPPRTSPSVRPFFPPLSLSSTSVTSVSRAGVYRAPVRLRPRPRPAVSFPGATEQRKTCFLMGILAKAVDFRTLACRTSCAARTSELVGRRPRLVNECVNGMGERERRWKGKAAPSE